MNLTKEQPPAKYTLELDQAELHSLCRELRDFRSVHPSTRGWPQLTRMFDLVREQVL